MSNEFIQKLAHQRAEEIFTAEYYLHVTDSWYLDEKFRFEELKVSTNSRKPTRKEADIYMGYMQDYFDEYKDKFYAGPLAQDAYGKCIDCISKLLKVIEYGNSHYSEFFVGESVIKDIKYIGNIFVDKHNSFCKNDKDRKNNQ